MSSRNDRRRKADVLDPNASEATARRAFDDWMQLHAALAFEPERAAALLAEFAEPARALEQVSLVRPLRPRVLRDLRANLERLGVVGLPLTSERYPESLRAINDPPVMLLVRGDLTALRGVRVAIVGARAATVQGLEAARELGRRLACAGVTVVSGLARGVDGAAHRGALEGGGRTIAVQACGPEQIYPAEHRKLAAEIVQSGAIVTEFPVGAKPRAPYFPLRNRVISGLSRAVIVVEARDRSGSLITARHAGDQGREVFAVPGSISAAISAGPNRLIREGATPIVRLDDLYDVFAAIGLDASAVDSPDEEVSESRGQLAEGGREILSLLEGGGLQRDELARRLGKPPEQLDLDLVDLQLVGRVATDRDGRLVRVGRRGGAG